jgi:hypothetical protein
LEEGGKENRFCWTALSRDGDLLLSSFFDNGVDLPFDNIAEADEPIIDPLLLLVLPDPNPPPRQLLLLVLLFLLVLRLSSLSSLLLFIVMEMKVSSSLLYFIIKAYQ